MDKDPKTGHFLPGNETAKMYKHLPKRRKKFDELLDYIGEEMANKLGDNFPKLPKGMKKAEYLAMRKWAQIVFSSTDEKTVLDGIKMLWERRYPKLSTIEIEDITPNEKAIIPAKIVDAVINQVLEGEEKALNEPKNDDSENK